MKVITNNELVAKRQKWANIIAPAALLILLGGLLTNFFAIRNEGDELSSIYLIITLTMLGMGFVLSTISSGLVNRWVREPRADQVLAKALKGMGQKTYLFNYTSKVPHIFVGDTKIYAIVVKGQDGEISVENDRWKRGFELRRVLRFFAEERLGHPSGEVEGQAEKVKKMLQPLPAGDDIEVQPIVVFSHPDVQLTVNGCEVPVLHSKQLKKYIRDETSKGKNLPYETKQALAKLFSGEA